MIDDLGKRGGATMPKRDMFTEISRLDARYFTEISKVGKRVIEGKEEQKDRMTGRCHAPPSRTKDALPG
jgi:hypothetical protein